VLGAGIGGLAAAHRLRELAEERGVALELAVFDAAGRPGGVAGTDLVQGALLERGPDTAVTHKPAAVALCARLGLGARLARRPPGSTAIFDGVRALPVPAGFALLAPGRIGPLLRSPLLAWPGRLRALAEPAVASRRAAAGEDESVASFVRRRYGRALLERLVEPIVGAIYMADVERLSLEATFPRCAALEREGRSVRRALRRAAEGGPPPLAALAGGFGELVDALLARLPPGALRLGARALALAREGGRFALSLAGGARESADAVVVAVPGAAAAPLLAPLDRALGEAVAAIDYASCATLHLAWPRAAVERPPAVHGLFVPRRAGLPLVAVTFVDVKFPERVPAGCVVARLFLGGAARADLLALSDADLAALGEGALAPLLRPREPPAFRHLVRHPRAMPQLAVGHLALVERIRARLEEHPGLELAGGPLGAYGVPDAIAAGESAAERLFERVAGRGEAPPGDLRRAASS
jgi:oxygen-dependent protoporphyrinogen oxidase